MDSSGFTRDFPARFYENYYANQSGGSGILPHFRPQQRGRGIFGKIFRGFVLPTLGKTASLLKREAPKRLLSLGRDVIGDVAEGRSFGSSLKNRGLSHLKTATGDILAPTAAKRGRRKKRSGRQVGGSIRKRRSDRRRRRRRKTVQRRKRRRTKTKKRTRTTVTPLFSRGRDIFA